MKRLLVLFALSVLPAVTAGDLDPGAAAWKEAPKVSLSLNRTPPLYSTDAPAKLEIPVVELQTLRSGDKTLVRLEWKDPSRDQTALPAARPAREGGSLVEQSPATGRFSDACAVMLPAGPVNGDVFPSLQMGDQSHPVVIYYYSASRGAAVMDASGRSTTRRTGKTFPAQAAYAAGNWQVTMELPEIVPGTPLAVAIWNGDQQDRDGRKYFSIWHKIP